MGYGYTPGIWPKMGYFYGNRKKNDNWFSSHLMRNEDDVEKRPYKIKNYYWKTLGTNITFITSEKKTKQTYKCIQTDYLKFEIHILISMLYTRIRTIHHLNLSLVILWTVKLCLSSIVCMLFSKRLRNIWENIFTHTTWFLLVTALSICILCCLFCLKIAWEFKMRFFCYAY